MNIIIFVSLIVCLIVIGFTILLGLKEKKKTNKYLPAIILVYITMSLLVFNLVFSKFLNFDQNTALLISIINLLVGLFCLTIGIIFDINTYFKSRKR